MMRIFIFIYTWFLTLFAKTALAGDPSPVPASSKFISDVKKTAGKAGLKDDRDFEAIIGSYINNILNFLGVAFLVLIIIGGFMWMTAGGNEQKVEKAKKIILSSTIGLAIILLAKMIAYFIIEIMTPK